MEIAILIIASLCLVSSLIFIIVLSVKQNKKEDEKKLNETLKYFGTLEAKIEQIKDSVKNDIALSLSNEMNKVLKEQKDNSEASNVKLERFQNNIQEALNKRFDALNEQVDKKFIDINKKVDDKLGEGFKTTSETIAQVRERLQAIDSAQKNIESLSKDVVSLKGVLEGNQTRGQYGEFQLSMILNSVFDGATKCYEEQYTLKKGKDENGDVRADAVVFMPEPNHMICIDSKFPFQDYKKAFESETEEEKENYYKKFKNDVKKHINDISNKYIIEGKTAPEAIMFIPNDGVFAYIHQNFYDDIVQFATDKRVIITSPTTIRPILVTINMVRIEVERNKHLAEVSDELTKLGKQFGLFADEWSKFSKSIETLSNKHTDLDKRVGRITRRFSAIAKSDLAEEEIKQIETDGENDG